jgi:predicted RNA methylase
MKRILKSNLDKFYTKKEIAIDLISKVNLDKSTRIVIDPCCGDGSFYSNINFTKIGIDISPDIEGVIKHDFLTWDFTNLRFKSNEIVVISNPPFGKQGSLALKFIKRCSLFSDTIAFILPLSFAKVSMKNKIPEYFHLEYEEILPDNSFLLDGVDYDVKCVFQIWKKKEYKREIIKNEKESGFTYTKNKNEAHLAIRRVGVYAGKTFIDCLDKSEQSHYFIVLGDIDKRDNLINKLNNSTWNDLTVGPRSISKGELNPIINDILENDF